MNHPLSEREKKLIPFYDSIDTGCPPCDNVKKLVRDLEGWGIPIFGAVLDMGCGHGRFARGVQNLPLVRNVLGVDYSPKRIDRAKNLNENKNTDFRVGSIYDGVEGKWDTIAVFETLEHLEDPRTAISALVRCLSDRGNMFGSLPINNAYKSHLRVWKDLGEITREFPFFRALDYRVEGHPYILWSYIR